MRSHTARVAARGLAFAVAALVGLAVTFGGAGVAGAAVVPTVGLGTAAGFGVLGGSTVTNTGPSTINRLNVGVSPGTAITGFPPGVITPPGVQHRADPAAAKGQGDALTAFNDAAGRSAAAVDRGLTDLVGKTLQPGVYQGNLSLTGTVTLDNRTNPDAVFIFQASSTLITGSGSVVKFTTPHPSCNVFWQVGSSATLGTGSTFVGTVLAHVSITAQTGATVTGRLLAATGAVTLDTNVITAPSCAPPSTTSSTPPTTPTSGTSTAPPTGPTTSTGRGTGTSTATSHPSTSTSPPNENTTPSTITRLTTTSTSPPNANTTPGTITRLTTTSTSPPNAKTTPGTITRLTTTSTGPSTNTTTPTGPVTEVTTTVSTTVLTQPSFPTGVPGGSGPAAPISPVTVIGALLMGLGCLLLLWRIPATRRLMIRAGTIVTGSRNRSGEHR